MKEENRLRLFAAAVIIILITGTGIIYNNMSDSEKNNIGNYSFRTHR